MKNWLIANVWRELPQNFHSGCENRIFSRFDCIQRLGERLSSYLSIQQTVEFVKNVKKLYEKYKPTETYLEFSTLTFEDKSTSDQIILKYFDKENFFEHLPELFWNKIEAQIKIGNKNNEFVAN